MDTFILILDEFKVPLGLAVAAFFVWLSSR